MWRAGSQPRLGSEGRVFTLAPGSQPLSTGQPRAGGVAAGEARKSLRALVPGVWDRQEAGTPERSCPPGHAPCAQQACVSPSLLTLQQALSSRPTPVLSPESKNLRERCSRPAQTQAASSRHRVTTTFGESKSFRRGPAGEWRGGKAEAERVGPEREDGASGTLWLQTSDRSRQAPTWDPFGFPYHPPRCLRASASLGDSLSSAAGVGMCPVWGRGRTVVLQAGPRPRGARGSSQLHDQRACGCEWP